MDGQPGLAAFGRDEGAKHTYYGLPAHLRRLAEQGGWLLAPSQSVTRPGSRLPGRLIQAGGGSRR